MNTANPAPKFHKTKPFFADSRQQGMRCYHKALNNRPLHIIPGENHTYNYNPEYVVGIVTAWLKDQLTAN